MSAMVFCSRLVVITSYLLTVVQSSSICPVQSLTKLSNEEQRKRHPPLLYWFPGVSAEWVKFLVEQATGHYTGSVVGFDPREKDPRDCGLHSVLCDGSVDDVNIASSAKVVPIAVTNRQMQRRTIGNGLKRGFRRVILLLYDPYRAMVDDFININSNSNSNNNAGIQGMNISQSSPFNVTALGDHVLRRAAEYQQTMELFLEHVLREIPSNNITIVRYDDLLNPLLRSQTLAQMLDFLLFPVDNERIHCAFGAAEANTFPLLLPFAHSNTISMAYQSLPVNIECHIKDQLYYFMTKFNYTEQPIPLVTTTATKRTCKISERLQCATRYPPLKFLSRSKTVNKAGMLLLSFPGSGNTWLRLLVEHATGYFSGSVDVNDAELMKAMPGMFQTGLYIIHSLLSSSPHPVILSPSSIIIIVRRIFPPSSWSIWHSHVFTVYLTFCASSIYSPPLSFLPSLPSQGESICGPRVVFVKGHPGDLAWFKKKITCG